MNDKSVKEMSVRELKSAIQGCGNSEKLDALVSELCDRYYRSGEIDTITVFVKKMDGWINRKISLRRHQPMTARDVLSLLQREVLDRLNDAMAAIRQEENKDKLKEQAIPPTSKEKNQ